LKSSEELWWEIFSGRLWKNKHCHQITFDWTIKI